MFIVKATDGDGLANNYIEVPFSFAAYLKILDPKPSLRLSQASTLVKVHSTDDCYYDSKL